MKNEKIKKVIIPVAGFGTRFLPATKAQPKEMLPIIDKPVVQFLVEEAVASGVTDIIFVVGRNKRAIEDHFDFAPELESALILKENHKALSEIRNISNMANFTFVRQKEPKGDGDAMLCVRHLIDENEPVGVLFGDNVFDSKVPCLKQMIDVFEKYKTSVVALEKVSKSEVSSYGIVRSEKLSGDIFKINDIIEKPKMSEAPSNLATAGQYIITRTVLDELFRLKGTNGNKELRLVDALKSVIAKEPVYGLLFDGKRYDCGSKIGFLKATVDFALKHPEVKDEFKKYLQTKKSEK